MEKENTTQSSLLPWEAEGSEIRCSLMLLQGHKEPGPGALLSHTSHPPHNAGAISVVAACSSPLARRVLVFRHRAWKGPSDLPLLSIHTQALRQSTPISKLRSSPLPRRLMLLDAGAGIGRCAPTPPSLLSVNRLESLPRITRCTGMNFTWVPQSEKQEQLAKEGQKPFSLPLIYMSPSLEDEPLKETEADRTCWGEQRFAEDAMSSSKCYHKPAEDR